MNPDPPSLNFAMNPLEITRFFGSRSVCFIKSIPLLLLYPKVTSPVVLFFSYR